MSFLGRIFGGRANAHYRAGMAAFNAGRHEEALGRFARAVDCGGADSDPILALARFYAAESAGHVGKRALERGETAVARQLFERALEWNPEHPPLQYLASVTAAAGGDLARAASLLPAVLAADPAHREALLLFAAVRHAVGARAEARALLSALHPGGTLAPYFQQLLEQLAPDFQELTSLLRDFATSGRSPLG